MFGFGKRESKADAALAVMEDAIGLVTKRWRYMCETIPYKPDAPLADRIATFCIPMYEGLKNTFPTLKAAPEPFLLIVVVKGIERSGTHTAEELYGALGMPPLPD
jgi:hypothetical protein